MPTVIFGDIIKMMDEIENYKIELGELKKYVQEINGNYQNDQTYKEIVENEKLDLIKEKEYE